MSKLLRSMLSIALAASATVATIGAITHGSVEVCRAAAAMPASGRTDEVGDLVRAFGRMSESVARHDREIRRIAYTDNSNSVYWVDVATGVCTR